jgi:hypothetical protein
MEKFILVKVKIWAIVNTYIHTNEIKMEQCKIKKEIPDDLNEQSVYS